MKCKVLSGIALADTSYYADVAFLTTPTPQEVVQGTLEILKRIYWEAKMMDDPLLNVEVEWEMTEGRIWDYLPQQPPSYPESDIIPQTIRRPQGSRDDSFVAGVAGFLIGAGL